MTKQTIVIDFDNVLSQTAKSFVAFSNEYFGTHLAIDDYLKHCASAAQHGIPSILFGDFAWNQHDMLPQGVTRCNGWDDVFGYFTNKKGAK